jgi:hypothetical protein
MGSNFFVKDVIISKALCQFGGLPQIVRAAQKSPQVGKY